MLKINTIILTALSLLLVNTVNANNITDDISYLQSEWAIINYETTEDEREDAFGALSQKAKKIVEKYPNHAEPLVWEGIILSTYAGVKGGLGALGLIEEARDRLLEAEKINPNALKGSIYTSLGSLYYQAPGWPISFGSNDDAKLYLNRALELNPDGIDPNYFYGDFLIEQGKYKEALTVLQHALEAPSRQKRPIADTGRKVDINKKIALAKKKIGQQQ